MPRGVHITKATREIISDNFFRQRLTPKEIFDQVFNSDISKISLGRIRNILTKLKSDPLNAQYIYNSGPKSRSTTKHRRHFNANETAYVLDMFTNRQSSRLDKLRHDFAKEYYINREDCPK